MHEMLDSFATKAAPVANFSWDVEAELAGDEEVTALIPAQFNQPVIIVGFYAEVIQTSFSSLVVPDLKDIKCELNANEDSNYTNSRAEVRVSNGPGAKFSQLGALLVQNRYIYLDLSNAAPDLGVRFAWKNWLPAFADEPIYEDAHISLTMFCKFPLREGAAKGRLLDAGR